MVRWLGPFQHPPEFGAHGDRLPVPDRALGYDRPHGTVGRADAAAVADALEDGQLALGLDDRLQRAHVLTNAATHAVAADDVYGVSRGIASGAVRFSVVREELLHHADQAGAGSAANSVGTLAA